MAVTQTSGAPPLDSIAAGDRIRFTPSISLTKAEAFGACQALADADRVLLRSGLISEAAALGDLFELLEQRLASPARPG
ncbi:MAG TPA: hypothetical protein VG014_13000 [Acidimicrobiales bacterium]|jgi:hypothetical protein|nr:hypothetical protein [Acidimicrobiales bacterium]